MGILLCLRKKFSIIIRKETFSEAKKTEIEDILTCLGEKGFDLDIVSINRIEADGTVIYEEKFSEDFSSYFNAWKSKNETLFVHFMEGNLENTVQFRPDGSVYVDGNRTSVKIKPETGNIELMAGVRTRMQKIDPLKTGGAAYTGPDYVYNSTAKVEFGATLATLTIGAIVTVITSSLSGWLMIASGIVSTQALSTTANWLKSKSPYYKYASFKDIRNGHPGDAVNYYYKHTVYAYQYKDYGGSRYKVDQYYEIKEST